MNSAETLYIGFLADESLIAAEFVYDCDVVPLGKKFNDSFLSLIKLVQVIEIFNQQSK